MIDNWIKKDADQYKKELTENILPFWLKYGLDKKHGGIYTCLNRDGSLMDRTKSVWFQGRFGYIAAYAYNNIEAKKEWLDASFSAIKFIENHCIDTDGRMFFEVWEDGTPLRKRRYLFSETFAIIAFAEYAKASKNIEYANKALELFKKVIEFNNNPLLTPSKYTENYQAVGHSFPMILMNTANIISQVVEDPILDTKIDEAIELIIKKLLKPEFKALLESVRPNGELIDTNAGRMINPGHCIETSWFLMDIANKRNDKELLAHALQILDWSWDWGWDEEFGGIINFKDCKGLPSQDYAQDMKFWWPQTEAIIANLYAYKLTKDEKYLNHYNIVKEWTYKHFVDSEFPEWYGYLHRDGTVAQPAKGNLFKGPFHIPRMMIRCYLLCNELIAEE